MSKQCKKCDEIKSENEFYPRYGREREIIGRYAWCKPCHNQRTINNHAKNKKSHNKANQKWHFRTKYGITIQFYTEVYKKQNGRCANRNCNYIGDLVVDHDHRTKKFRALLCRSCNLALGHVDDNVSLLEGLADYLEEHRD